MKKLVDLWPMGKSQVQGGQHPMEQLMILAEKERFSKVVKKTSWSCLDNEARKKLHHKY